MRGVNKVHLLGRLGDDPSVKYTQGGTAVTNVSLATTSVRKDRDGNQVETTAWHRVVFFGKTAEVAGEYLRKGSQVYIEGEIRYGSFEKDGVKHYTTDIVANELQMLGGKSDSPREDRPPRPERGTQRPQRQAPQRAPAGDFADDFADSDIPF